MHIPHTVIYTFPKVLISSLVDVHFLFFRNLGARVRFRANIVRKIYMPVTLWGQKVKFHPPPRLNWLVGVSLFRRNILKGTSVFRRDI